MTGRRFLISLPFYLFYTLLIALSQKHIFFWDSVMQVSKWAHWYYENDFAFLFLPAELDAGHPPGLAMLVALVWKFTGKSLLVSHWLMWPFVMGIIWQTERLVSFFVKPQLSAWAMLLLLTDATLMAQCSLVSTDVVMTFLTLSAINGILYRKKVLLMTATAALVLCSLRGIFTIAALFLFSEIFDYLKYSKIKLYSIRFFIPALIVACLWYLMHFIETGWWLQSPNQGWSSHRSWATPFTILKNMVVLVWRMLDFGRLGEGLLLLWLGWYFIKNKLQAGMPGKLLIAFLFSFYLCYLPVLLFITNPVGHRYLIPAFLLTALLSLYLLQETNISILKKRFIIMLMVVLHLSGHLWVYPRDIAQGWDASLAHLPYFELRDQAMQYISTEAIPLESIGTDFPNIGPIKFLDASENLDGLSAKDLQQNQYYLYATVFNDVTQSDWKELETNWIREKSWHKGQIQLILFKRKE